MDVFPYFSDDVEQEIPVQSETAGILNRGRDRRLV